MQADASVSQATPGLSAVFGDEHSRVEFQEAWWDLPHFGRQLVQIDDIWVP